MHFFHFFKIEKKGKQVIISFTGHKLNSFLVSKQLISSKLMLTHLSKHRFIPSKRCFFRSTRRIFWTTCTFNVKIWFWLGKNEMEVKFFWSKRIILGRKVLISAEVKFKICKAEVWQNKFASMRLILANNNNNDNINGN